MTANVAFIMDKASLRKLYTQKRSELSSFQIGEASATVAQNFAKLSLAGIKYLHAFYPIVGKAEMDSLKIIEWLRETQPEINLVLSKSDLKNHSLSHFIWEEDTPLAINSWGITEPEHGELVESGQLDMILVPLLVFDKRGNRVGYGKGFYDRFLSQCRPDVQKVGLSFFDPIEEISDANQFDITLDVCITPNKIWQF